MRKLSCIVVVTIAAAVGTWVIGWWAIPIVALSAGLLGCGAGMVAIGSALAWLLLLGIDAASGEVSRVATTLAGIMGIPPAAILLLTIVFPALLGWSAAALGAAARSIHSTLRQPS
jgi:hypothetical protein